MKKPKQKASGKWFQWPRVKLALVLIVGSTILSLFEWRYISIYVEYSRGSTETVNTGCMSVSEEFVPTRRGSGHAVYTLHLRSGETVAVLKHDADQLFSSEAEMTQLLTAEKTLQITYIESPELRFTSRATAHALVSISKGSKELIPAQTGMAYFARRTNIEIVVNLIFYAIALLCLAIPPVVRHYLERKRQRRKQQKKARKLHASASHPTRKQKHRKK